MISVDGFNSYIIIVDRVTCYMWIFLRQSNTPPIIIVQHIFNKFKYGHTCRALYTDQEKELGKSADFQEMVDKEGLAMELTGTDTLGT